MRNTFRWSLLLLFSCTTETAVSTDSVLVVDHKTRKATLEGRTYESGDEVRIRGGGIKISVTNTNTALYAYALKGEKVPAPEIETLNTFFKGLGPYFAEAGRSLVPPEAMMAVSQMRAARTDTGKRASPEEERAENLIEKIDAAMNGPKGARNTALAAIYSLQKVHEGTLTPEKSAEEECRALSDRFEDASACSALPNASSFQHLKALAEIASALNELSTLSWELHKAGGDASDSVDGILENAEKITAAAYHAEALAVAVIHSRSIWESTDQDITWDEGRSLTLTISAKRTPELARLADLGDLEFKITVLADWLVRPAVGLSSLYSPNSSFPTYTAVGKDPDFRVQASGTNDKRFQWGLTLSLTWRGLDWRKNSDVAIWLPELTVNPSSDVKAVAVGAGVSWKFVKLGGGVMWTRHTALEGLRPGDPLTSKDDLKTTDAYGRPNGYVSLSIVGWQPFVPEKP